MSYFSIIFIVFSILAFFLFPEYKDNKKIIQNIDGSNLYESNYFKYWYYGVKAQFGVYIIIFIFLVILLIFISINKEKKNKTIKIIFYFLFYIAAKIIFFLIFYLFIYVVVITAEGLTIIDLYKSNNRVEDIEGFKKISLFTSFEVINIFF